MKLLNTLAITSIALSTPLMADEAPDYSDHKAVLAYAEFMVHPDSGKQNFIEIFAKDTGNGQLGADYVYNDPRRASFNGGEAGVTFAVNDNYVTSDPGVSNQAFWMRESVAKWNELACSNAQVTEIPHNGNPGVVELFFRFGGIFPVWGADLTQVGFRDSSNFPYFTPGSGVLGVAFTLTWVDGDNNPTDIDNNGKTDVAFREIYYNDNFNWSDSDTPTGVDLPTVAIHEVGHGLSAAHFGLVAVKDTKDGPQLFAKPRAIMNAIYGGKYREFSGRDKGSHCSNWAQWPNN